jgi:hypothetical protein
VGGAWAVGGAGAGGGAWAVGGAGAGGREGGGAAAGAEAGAGAEADATGGAGLLKNENNAGCTAPGEADGGHVRISCKKLDVAMV